MTDEDMRAGSAIGPGNKYIPVVGVKLLPVEGIMVFVRAPVMNWPDITIQNITAKAINTARTIVAEEDA